MSHSDIFVVDFDSAGCFRFYGDMRRAAVPKIKPSTAVNVMMR